MPADVARRVVAYCEAMRDGRLQHRVTVAGIDLVLEISRGNFGHDIFVASGELQEAREMEALLAQPLPQRGVILDIGANSGSYTVFLAKAFPRCTIVPMECVAAMCEVIRHNVALNRLANVDLRHLGKAAGGDMGHARLVADRNHGAVGTQALADAAGGVPMTTVDALELPPLAFAKIDVEGQELEVLKGMKRTFARSRFPLLVEVHERNLLGFLGHLCHWQFRVRAIMRGAPGGAYANFLIERI